MQLRVRKIPGQEGVALLEKLDAGSKAPAHVCACVVQPCMRLCACSIACVQTGLWSRVTEILHSGGSHEVDHSNETIHVFSLA